MIDRNADAQEDTEERKANLVARKRLRENLEQLERTLREARINESQLGEHPATSKPNADVHWRWPWQR